MNIGIRGRTNAWLGLCVTTELEQAKELTDYLIENIHMYFLFNFIPIDAFEMLLIEPFKWEIDAWVPSAKC